MIVLLHQWKFCLGQSSAGFFGRLFDTKNTGWGALYENDGIWYQNIPLFLSKLKPIPPLE